MKKVINYSFRLFLCFFMLIPYFLEPFSVMAATNNSKATTIAGLRKELEALKKQKTDAQNSKKQTQSEINKNKQAVADARAEQSRIVEEVADSGDTDKETFSVICVYNPFHAEQDEKVSLDDEVVEENDTADNTTEDGTNTTDTTTQN